MLDELLQKIAAPGPEFRGAPFWAWNAKLDPEELRRQIRLFKEMGLGGFFMHSRVGLNTPYLSQEWFQCINACIDEAQKQGMKAWLYDEDRWPSGAAGGLVTKDPRYRQRYIALTQLKTVPETLPENLLGLFSARIREDHACSVRRFVPGKDALAPEETLLVFEKKLMPQSSWFNDQTYLDTMNPEAVARFIEVTHEVYRKNIASHFGKTVPGIFTDEPNYFQIDDPSMRPWTDALPEEFQKRYGYSLCDHLAELFFFVDDELFSRARLDYYNLATSLFVNSFARLCGEWCSRNHLLFTGHVMAEDDPLYQTVFCGAAMRFYEFQQQPGIDLLTEHWNVFDAAKQCSSAAHQFGRRWRLSETYGCTGWDFPFMGHKALGDWQFALGINFRCQHLAWYSMSAEAKRDYPASISYQSPWLSAFGTVEDYFARLGAALSEGEEQRDLLVIHPIESTWGATVFTPCSSDERKIRESESLCPLSHRILAGNIDFDYGDEDILSRYGSVQGTSFAVRHARYKAVLIPQLRTIRRTTLALLSAFQKAGGAVFYLGTAPRFVDGIPDAQAAGAFQNFTAVQEEELLEKLSPAARRVSITDETGREIGPALHILRKAEDHETLFLCNCGMDFTLQENTEDIRERKLRYRVTPKLSKCAPMVRDRVLEYPAVVLRIKAAPEEAVYELDLMTGKLTSVESRHIGLWTEFRTSLPKLGSRLFLLSSRKPASVSSKEEPHFSGKSLVLPAQNWRFETDDFNVFVLDHASYSVDGKPCGTEYILTLDDKLRTDHLQTRPRGGKMAQPWFVTRAETPEKQLDLKLEYRFLCAAVPEKECFLGIERPDLYEMEFNGRKLEAADCGWWCDLSMRRIALAPQLFRQGENTLVLKCRYHQNLPGLEALFLLGDFGVSGNALTPPVRTLHIGDWCSQGLPNFAGNAVYCNTFQLDEVPAAAKLCLGKWRGVGLAVSVNQSEWQMLPFPPFELPVSRWLKSEENQVAIKVFGHRRNSHGPFYSEDTWPLWTSSVQFKEYVSPDRKLVPCGLLEPPVLKY